MEKEVLSIRRKRLFSILSGLPPLLFALLYGGGYIAQFIRNHTVWKNAGGTPGYGTAPEMPSFILSASFEALFTLPYGGLSAASYVSACWCCSLSWLCGWDMGTLENTIRNGILSISQKGTYGTSGFMSEKEAEEVLKLTSSLKKHTGTILGTLDGKYVCVPEESRLNKNIAVYGASGSMKTRVLYQPHSSGCRTGGIIDYLRSEI